MRKNVDMIACMKQSGVVIPLTLIWDDGRKFDIEKVLDIRRAASTKGGGMGIRYLLKIGKSERYAWLDEYTWFVETDK